MKKDKELKELQQLTKDELVKNDNVKSILSEIGKLANEERVSLYKQFEKLYWEEGNVTSLGGEFDTKPYGV